VAVELVVLFLDRLDPVEERDERILQCFGVPFAQRSARLFCLSRAGPRLFVTGEGGNSLGLLGLTFATRPALPCRGSVCLRSFFSGSWPSRHRDPRSGQ
jgi:hypothetical protein